MPMTNQPRRRVTVGNPTCLLGFSGRDSVDSAVFDGSTIQPGGVSAVQTATITGTPTGGTFKLAFRGQATSALAYNATGATVQAALRALSRVGAAGVTVTGGAGGPYVVTFGGKLASRIVPLLTLSNNSLTGGTTPTVAVVETTKGDSTYAGLFVLRSGLPLMANGSGQVKEWDYSNPAQLLGIFDGLRELLTQDESPIIPVYNHECVFDVAVVKNYAANKANYDNWAAAHVCQFKSQG